jgi:hypothetical protein
LWQNFLNSSTVSVFLYHFKRSIIKNWASELFLPARFNRSSHHEWVAHFPLDRKGIRRAESPSLFSRLCRPIQHDPQPIHVFAPDGGAGSIAGITVAVQGAWAAQENDKLDKNSLINLIFSVIFSIFQGCKI